jgi:hypothetical protein
MSQPLNLALEIRSHRRLTAWRSARIRAQHLAARVRELEAERALYVGHEPTAAEEMAELSRRLDAADAVVEQWADHCLGPQTRQFLDEIRAALDGEPAPSGPTRPA